MFERVLELHHLYFMVDGQEAKVGAEKASAESEWLKILTLYLITKGNFSREGDENKINHQHAWSFCYWLIL